VKNNLKQFRTEAGLSLQGLGDLCGISRPHLHDLEKETGSAPKITTAYAIAKVLEKSVYDIWPDTTKVVEKTVIVRRVVSA
jgi:Predicted transcriptional regulators